MLLLFLLLLRCVGGFVVPAPRAASVSKKASVTEVFDAVEDLVISGGPLAAYAAVVLCDSLPLVPTQPLTIAAGAAFGLGPGLAIVMAGQTTAAAICFTIGRSVIGPDKVEGIFGPKFVSVASQFAATEDWETTFKSVLLLRQSPVIPFSVGNYILGAATNAPIPALMAGTIVGCLPLNALYTATGAAVKEGAKAFLDNLGLDLLEVEEILGLVGAGATVAIVYFAAQALRQEADE